MRPLHLRPLSATTVRTTSLSTTAAPIAAALCNLGQLNRARMKEKIHDSVLDLRAGCLSERAHTTEPAPFSKLFKEIRPLSLTSKRDKLTIKDCRPAMIHKKWLATLLVILIAIAMCMLVLRKFAREQKLYRTTFVYQVNLGLFNIAFSPHLVVTTLVAVILGLCWDGIDKPMRILQPYLSMSRRPPVTSRGAALSYKSCYWVWAAFKVASRRHWILCLATISTTLSQVRK
jgi:hypothetical protein